MIVAGLMAFAAVFPQSGRRIKTQPTPAPETAVSVDDGYSESRSYKPVRIYPPNYKRKKEKKREEPKEEAIEPVGEDVISIDATLVNIPVSVYNKNGLYISGLRREQFKVFEDGKEQEIAYFGAEDTPVTVVILLDTSGSTEYKIDDIRRAATAFVDELGPNDSVMVIEFASGVNVLTEPTTDRQKIYRAINRVDFGGGTSLYDAVEFALTKRIRKIEGRKAIILFTDGVDTTSLGASYGENIEDAEESDAVIFPIYYNTFLDAALGGGGVMSAPFPIPSGGGIGNTRQRGTRPEDYALGKQYLEDIAAYTGGRVYKAGSSALALQSTFEAIAEELKRQYQLGYYPEDEGKTGQRKNIKVRVYRSNVIVRARDSYIVGEN